MVNWTESQLSQSTPPPNISEGDVFPVERIESDGVLNKPIYIRPGLVERKKVFDEFLSTEQFKQLYITGPPGSGKTLFLFLLSRMYAHNDDKNVLFVGYRDDQLCPILAFHGRDSALELDRFPDNVNLRSTLETIFAESGVKYDLVVYDGVRQSIAESKKNIGLLNSEVGHKLSKVVFVTSLAFRLRGGDVLPDFNRIHDEDSFDSWEGAPVYVDAMCKMLESDLLDPLLAQDIRNHATSSNESKEDYEWDEFKERDVSAEEMSISLTREVVESYVEFKYYYAGGSARFMFDFDIERLKRKLGDLIDAVKGDQWKAFTSCSIPSATDDAVNSLMQRFRDGGGAGKATAVSKFIVMIAYDKCGSMVAEAVALAAKATGNPSLVARLLN